MPIERAMQILYIVKCDLLGYARDLAYTPGREEIRQAFEVAEAFVEERK